jgi:pimeloyl-ACP methyl ester carboxylesterase
MTAPLRAAASGTPPGPSAPGPWPRTSWPFWTTPACARVEPLDGAGHLPYWEQPRRFARMVAGFLTDPAASAHESTWTVRRAS